MFRDHAKDDLQVVDVSMVRKDTDQPVDGYHVVNLLRVVSAANIEQSVVSEAYRRRGKLHIITFAFDEARVPRNVHLFRPAESLSAVVISDAVADEIRNWAKGVALIPTKTV